MTDTGLYIQRLLEADPLRKPVLRNAVQALQLPRGSRGLDIGCGIGLQTLLLSDAVGSEGHVTGMDILPGLLKFGEDLVEQAGFSGRITFREGDMYRLPFDSDTFDWVWSADCIGYPVGELIPLLKELAGVVKPGGSVIILAWSSQQLLPGYPMLEARLNATCSSYIPMLKGANPDLHFLRALHAFRETGLEDVRVRTLVRDVRTPFGVGEREALTSLFNMLWGQAQPEDWKDYQRLCEPGSSDFILDIPDYYAFFTYSMFWGKVPFN